MRKGKFYPLLPNEGYQIGLVMNRGAPRRLSAEIEVLYQGLPWTYSGAFQLSDEYIYNSPIPTIESAIWTIPVPGFLWQIEMVLDTIPTRLFTIYSDLADPFGNKLGMYFTLPQVGGYFPQGALSVIPFSVSVQDAPWGVPNNWRMGPIRYGELPPPWPT